jgi:hypothetical protein
LLLRHSASSASAAAARGARRRVTPRRAARRTRRVGLRRTAASAHAHARFFWLLLSLCRHCVRTRVMVLSLRSRCARTRAHVSSLRNAALASPHPRSLAPRSRLLPARRPRTRARRFLDPRRRRPRVFVARFDRSLQTRVVTRPAGKTAHERGDTSNGTSPRGPSTEAGRSFGRTAPTIPGQSFGNDRRPSTYSRRTDDGFPCPRASSRFCGARHRD